MWKSRSNEPELIDLGPGHYTMDEYHHCLKQLDKVGKWLGGDSATFQALGKMEQPPLSILDVGCGGGHYTTKIARRYSQAKVVGIDLNPHAIHYARKKRATMPKPPTNLSFETREQVQLQEPGKSYDVVMATLVCHHMNNEDLIDFIKRACSIARRKVVINDLHRHPLAYYLFMMICPILFPNRLVRHDGPLSVRRAFKYGEWVYYLEKSGLEPSQYRISWHWAFRWLVEINSERIPA